MRTNIVGTNWVWVTRCSLDGARNASASKRSIITTVPPMRVHDAAEAQRGGVVERRGREVDGVLVEAVDVAEDGHER